MRVQLKKANKLAARFVIIIGIMEARKQVCQFKDMDEGTQIELPLDEVIPHVLSLIDKDTLSFYHPSKDWIIEETEEVND